MKLQVLKDQTSKRIAVFIQDSTSTTGIGKTGLVYNSANLVWYYWRESDGDVAGTAVTKVTMTRGTWASGGFIEKDATNMPGFYEIGIPNAALATGANWVVMVIRDSSTGLGIAPCTIEIQLMDALPVPVENVWSVTTRQLTGTQTFNNTGTWTGNITGSVGSVTGAVGSVTGAVGSVTGSVGSVAGNVTGSVGSVAGNVTGTVASVVGNVGGNVVGSVASVTGAVGSVTGSVGSVAAGGITASSIATGAIDADALATDAVAEIVDAVWDEDVDTTHQTAGTAGKKLDDAGSAGDPWGTALPGSYTSGQAGYIVGTNLNATVSSRSSHAAADIWGVATRQLTGTQTFNNTGTWTGNVSGSVGSVTGAVGSVTGNVGGNVVGSVASVSGAVGSVTGNVGGNVVGSVASVTGAVGSVTGNVGGNVTGSVGSVAAGGITAASIATGAIDADALAADAGTELGTAVWATAARTLTAGTNIVLAKGVGVTGFNDLSAADVNAEVLDVVNVDTMAQLAQAAPTATPTMRTALMQLYMWNRNKTTESSSQASLYDDAGATVLQKAALSDVASVFTKDEIASGP